VAQTRRKRQTKHRGNAAGVVESRGRTGRKPTAAEKSGDRQALGREKDAKLDRRDRPPTWGGAFIKGMFAGVFLLLVVIVFMHQSNGAIALFPIAIGFYTVISYYTDRFVYDRRQRKKASERSGGKAASR
jgi:hypothetical protein